MEALSENGTLRHPSVLWTALTFPDYLYLNTQERISECSFSSVEKYIQRLSLT